MYGMKITNVLKVKYISEKALPLIFKIKIYFYPTPICKIDVITSLL